MMTDKDATKTLTNPPVVRARDDVVVDDGRNGRSSGPVAVSDSAAIIDMIARAARDPDVDIEKFERLMAMRERMDAKNAERAFNAAISEAKGAIPPIYKNKTVDFTSQKGRTNYRHEDFAEIARVVDPILGEHGLSYRFRSKQDGQKLRVTCIMSHVGGYVEETTLEAAEDHSGNKNPIQAIGSAATYLQRYTLKLALGLATSADDDARATSAKEPTTTPEDRANELRALIARAGASEGKVCERHSVECLEDLPVKDYEAAKAGLFAMIRKNQAGAK